MYLAASRFLGVVFCPYLGHGLAVCKTLALYTECDKKDASGCAGSLAVE